MEENREGSKKRLGTRRRGSSTARIPRDEKDQSSRDRGLLQLTRVGGPQPGLATPRRVAELALRLRRLSPRLVRHRPCFCEPRAKIDRAYSFARISVFPSLPLSPGEIVRTSENGRTCRTNRSNYRRRIADLAWTTDVQVAHAHRRNSSRPSPSRAGSSKRGAGADRMRRAWHEISVYKLSRRQTPLPRPFECLSMRSRFGRW